MKLATQKRTRNKSDQLRRPDRQNIGRRTIGKRQHQVDEALELMRGIVRAPIGQSPERDARVKAAWRCVGE